MSVKKSVLVPQDLVKSTNGKYLSLLRASSELIGAITVKSAFSTTDHLLALREERCYGKKNVMMPTGKNSRD